MSKIATVRSSLVVVATLAVVAAFVSFASLPSSASDSDPWDSPEVGDSVCKATWHDYAAGTFNPVVVYKSFIVLDKDLVDAYLAEHSEHTICSKFRTSSEFAHPVEPVDHYYHYQNTYNPEQPLTEEITRVYSLEDYESDARGCRKGGTSMEGGILTIQTGGFDSDLQPCAQNKKIQE